MQGSSLEVADVAAQLLDGVDALGHVAEIVGRLHAPGAIKLDLVIVVCDASARRAASSVGSRLRGRDTVGCPIDHLLRLALRSRPLPEQVGGLFGELRERAWRQEARARGA